MYKTLTYFLCISVIAINAYANKPLPASAFASDNSELYISAPINIQLMMLFAFIGGFILNFMPCVLPVLALKAYAFIKHPEQNSRKICISVIAGIIFSFIILGLIAIALKSSGQYVGFGINFQNPEFIITLCIVITIFISSALGKINFSISPVIQENLSKTHFNQIYLNGFFSGILATILSTPCSAPFLGTAIAFAVASSNDIILLGFLSAGLGFALPYFIIILCPRLLNCLPKAGPWMDKFKIVLALLLFTTLFWLLSILYVQIGWRPTAGFVGLIILIKYIIEA